MSNSTTPISEIIIGFRHRKDMGNLQILADSIAAQGLLQPIGITENRELVFGARRLEAHKLLGWSEIETRVVNVTSIVEGEFAENELRKDFDVSEKVAITAAVADEIGKRERRGRPTLENIEEKNREPEPTFSDTSLSPSNTKDEITFQQGRIRDLAAQKVGWSGRTFEHAKKVVEHGTEELVKAMDAKEISIKVAAKIAELQPEEQVDILRQPKNVIIDKAKRLYKPRKKSETQSRSNTKPSKIKAEPCAVVADIRRLQTDAHRFATIALSHLQHIHKDDQYRRDALMRVREWIDEQLNEGAPK